MIVGLAGLARSGKDSFYKFSEKIINNSGMESRRLAFADELKKELIPFLRKSFGIDAFTEDENEKEIIRPILVAYGMAKRQVSNGTYWVERVFDQIKRQNSKNLFFITDVRFENEIDAITEGGGKIVYVSRKGNPPANSEEELNNPTLIKNSHYFFEWDDFCKIQTPQDLVFSFYKKNNLFNEHR
jgi:hypothetical protein